MTKLALYESASTIELESIFDLPAQKIAKDWYGKSNDLLFFYFAVDPYSLFFGASSQLAPNCDLSFGTGEFCEGLWKRDVAELFISSQGSRRYQEYNLSPTGAWWSNRFSAVRKSEGNFFKPEGIAAFSEISRNSWRAGISIPRNTLLGPIEASQCRANVCMIYGEPQSFCTWSHIPLAEPDFHQPQYFSEIEMRPL